MQNFTTGHRVIQLLSFMLGLSAVAIGAAVFLLGPQTVLHFTEAGFDRLTGQTPQLEPATVSTTLDNEFRFYAVFWMAYGLVLVWVAWDIVARVRFIPILMGLFFLGGVGRVLSIFFVGSPHPAFVALMAIELIVPLVVAIFYARLPNGVANDFPSEGL